MAGIKNPLQGIRIVYRRSSTLLKCVVLAAILLSMAALLALRANLIAEQEKQDDLRDQVIAQEQEQEDLQDRIDDLGSVQSVQQIAEDELDLVDPDTVIMTPTE